jgi:hypothetical protein
MTTIDLTASQPPVIDGHLWVVKDGKIIDPHFKNYNFIANVRGVSNKKNYLPAEPRVQEVLIKKWSDFLENIPLDGWKDECGMCFINAIAYQRKYGGELVFGSLGFGEDNIWWEFGGEGWGLLQFLKRNKIN